MKRYRITIQIGELDRQAIDKLVWDHRYASVSHAVRVAIEQFLMKTQEA